MVKETIISVQTGAAVKNIAELRENIKAYKQILSEAEFGTEEYKEAIDQLQASQQMLRDAMHNTSASYEELNAAVSENTVQFDKNNEIVTMEGVSYNALVNKLADLKQAWRSTTDEQKRAQLGEQINNVNDKLKGMDKTVGVFGRNVGNYVGAVDHLAGALGSMGGGARGLIAPIKGVTLGFQTLSATPAVAILGLLANVLMAVIKALKSSEEGTQAMTAAMAPFSAIGDVVTKMLQGLGKAVVWVVEKFAALTQAIFKNNDATQKRIELAQKEKQITEQTRKTVIANAEAERDVAELRAKASDKATYSAKERLGFLQQAGELERQIAERAYQDAQLQYETIRLRNSTTESSTEDLQKEADAYAAMVKAETNYYKKMREINAGITEARRAETQEFINENKAKEDARKAELESYRALLQQEIELAQKGSQERYDKQKELLDKEYEAAVQNAKDKITNQETLNRTLLALQKKHNNDIRKLDTQNQDEQNENTLAGMRRIQEGRRKDSLQWWQDEVKIRQQMYFTMQKQDGENEDVFQTRREKAHKAVLDAIDKTLEITHVGEKTRQTIIAKSNEQTKENTLYFNAVMLQAEADYIEERKKKREQSEDEYQVELLDAQAAAKAAWDEYGEYQIEQERLTLENRMNEYRDGSLLYLQQAVYLKEYELKTLHKLEEESNEEFRARQLAAEKEYYDARAALANGFAQTLGTVAGGVSDLMNTLADLYESNTNATKAEQIKAKNLRIAGATIDMFSGVVTAIAQAQEMGPILGPIMAGVNSAAVIAAGMANINKIRATQISTSSAPSTSAPEVPAVVEAPTVTPTVQEYRNITSRSEEERLNQIANQRVYILSSDLEADRNATRVRTQETTF